MMTAPWACNAPAMLREAARLFQEVEIVLDPHLREVEGPLRRMDDVHYHASVREGAHQRGHVARALREAGRHEEADAEAFHVAATSRGGGATRPAQSSSRRAPSSSAA